MGVNPDFARRVELIRAPDQVYIEEQLTNIPDNTEYCEVVALRKRLAKRFGVSHVVIDNLHRSMVWRKHYERLLVARAKSTEPDPETLFLSHAG